MIGVGRVVRGAFSAMGAVGSFGRRKAMAAPAAAQAAPAAIRRDVGVAYGNVRSSRPGRFARRGGARFKNHAKGRIGVRRAGAVAATLGVSTMGFHSGFDKDREVTDAFYQAFAGSPDFDKQVLGRSQSVGSMINPLPTIRFASLESAALRVVTPGGGGGNKYVNSAVTALDLKGRGLLTADNYATARRKARYHRDKPMVSGDTVLGMYNSRLG